MAKPKKKTKRARQERQFFPRSTTPPMLINGLGGLGAAGLGAGAYGQFIRQNMPIGEPMPYATWIAAAGFVALGAAIWFGTTSEGAVRVGDAGLALVKGDVKRMPWSEVASVRLEEGAVMARGKDEDGRDFAIKVLLASNPDAAARIVHEARTRVPSVVEIPEDAEMPAIHEDAGALMRLDPMQVVGKRCAKSGKIIAYEPDARVCARCERVYHKEHVPPSCACGGTMTADPAVEAAPAPEAAVATEQASET